MCCWDSPEAVDELKQCSILDRTSSLPVKIVDGGGRVGGIIAGVVHAVLMCANLCHFYNSLCHINIDAGQTCKLQGNY